MVNRDSDINLKDENFTKVRSRPEIESDYSRSGMSSMELDDSYEDYQHPPDMKQCELYGKATKIGHRIPLKEAKKDEISLALLQSSVVTPHPVCFKDKDISYLSTGYVLYFFFLKYLIVIAIIMIAFEVYKMLIYYRESACGGLKVPGCELTIFTILSVANFGIHTN